MNRWTETRTFKTITSFVTLTTYDSLGAIGLSKDLRKPNYLSFGLRHGYKLGDIGLL